MMTSFNEYQDWTETTAIYTDPAYPQLALAEEVGEFLGKLAKFKRDVAGRGMPPEEYIVHAEKLRADVTKEAGDILWQLARVLKDLDIPMQDAVDVNVAKLESRKERNVLNGSGDDR